MWIIFKGNILRSDGIHLAIYLSSIHFLHVLVNSSAWLYCADSLFTNEKQDTPCSLIINIVNLCFSLSALAESIMETCNSKFESVDEILWPFKLNLFDSAFA